MSYDIEIAETAKMQRKAAVERERFGIGGAHLEE